VELAVINADMGDYKKDDILVVKPDGHPWTKKERESKAFRIVTMPGKAEEYKYLQLGDHPDVPDAKLRLYKLDAANLPVSKAES